MNTIKQVVLHFFIHLISSVVLTILVKLYCFTGRFVPNLEAKSLIPIADGPYLTRFYWHFNIFQYILYINIWYDFHQICHNDINCQGGFGNYEDMCLFLCISHHICLPKLVIVTGGANVEYHILEYEIHPPHCTGMRWCTSSRWSGGHCIDEKCLTVICWHFPESSVSDTSVSSISWHIGNLTHSANRAVYLYPGIIFSLVYGFKIYVIYLVYIVSSIFLYTIFYTKMMDFIISCFH